MSQQEQIKLFEEKKIRSVWDDEKEEWYFSVVDVCSVLNGMDYQTARKYWKVLKGRLIKEGFQPVTNCYQLKLMACDGKKRLTDVLPLNNSSASSNLYLQARLNLEQQLGHSIISKDKATDYLPPADSWDEQPNEIDDKED